MGEIGAIDKLTNAYNLHMYIDILDRLSLKRNKNQFKIFKEQQYAIEVMSVGDSFMNFYFMFVMKLSKKLNLFKGI